MHKPIAILPLTLLAIAACTCQTLSAATPATAPTPTIHEERLISLDGAIADYFHEYTNRGKAHTRQSDLWWPPGLGSLGPPQSIHSAPSHIFFKIAAEKGFSLVADGQIGPTYDRILNPTFAADGKTVIYRASKDGKFFLHIGDKALTPYNYVDLPVFNNDGRHMTYGAIKDGKWIIVADGQEGPPFEDIKNQKIAISPDGRTAYAAYIDGKWIEIIDGKPALPTIGLGRFFGPNGKHFAYVAIQNDKQVLVVDGVPGIPRDEILGIAPIDDDHVADVAYEPAPGNQKLLTLYLGNQQIARTPLDSTPNWANFVTLPDRRPFVWYYNYGIPVTDHHLIPVDPKVLAPYANLSRPAVSSDGLHLAFWTTKNGNPVIVVDGKEFPGYTYIYKFFLSPTGGHWACLVPENADKPDQNLRVVIDGKPGPQFDSIVSKDPTDVFSQAKYVTFSRDGTHSVYIGVKSGRPTIMYDNEVYTNTPDNLATVELSPDGARLATWSLKDKRLTLSIDGTPGPTYTYKTRTADDTALEWLAIRDNVLYRTKVTFK